MIILFMVFMVSQYFYSINTFFLFLNFAIQPSIS